MAAISDLLAGMSGVFRVLGYRLLQFLQDDPSVMWIFPDQLCQAHVPRRSLSPPVSSTADWAVSLPPPNDSALAADVDAATAKQFFKWLFEGFVKG